MPRKGTGAFVATVVIVLSSIVPQLALVGSALPDLPPVTAPDPAAAAFGGPRTGAAYAHQFGPLQNPVLDPGFEIGAASPFWTLRGNARVSDGALVLPPSGSAFQTLAVSTLATDFDGVSPGLNGPVRGLVRDHKLGLAASPFTGFGALSFRATGPGAVTVYFVEDATGEAFGGVPVSFRAGENRVPAARFVTVGEDGFVSFVDPSTGLPSSSSGLTADEIFLSGHPLRIEFRGTTADVRVDDVVADGVVYGHPRAHVGLDGPSVSDVADAIVSDRIADAEAILQNVAGPNGVALPAPGAAYASDGYSLLILPIEFAPQRVDAEAAASRAAALVGEPTVPGEPALPPAPDAAALAATPGTWRFAVFLLEHAPSGSRIVDAASLYDAQLFLSGAPDIGATTTAAFPRGFVDASKTPYAQFFTAAGLDGRGLVFRSSTTVLASLATVARWTSPAADGGLYDVPEARGFLNPFKILLLGNPVSDALDAVPGIGMATVLGAVPCPTKTDISYRFGDLDCDEDLNALEVSCGVDLATQQAYPLQPDPTNAATTCSDVDGDGLRNDFDPYPRLVGALEVNVTNVDADSWWNDARAIGYAIKNSFNSDDAQELPIRVVTRVVFQVAGDEGFEGVALDCRDGEVVTTALELSGTCRIDTAALDDQARRILADGRDYRAVLRAEVVQGEHAPPYFGAAARSSVSVDNTDPATTIDVPTATGLAGWHVEPVTVTLGATDATSGVAETLFRVNGGAWTTYAGPIAVRESGVFDLDAYTEDVAGNVETPVAARVMISLEPPTTSCDAGAPAASGWFVAAPTVTCSADSNTPGYDLRYRVGDGAFSAYAAPFVVATEGAGVRVESYAVDDAGQSGAAAPDVAVLRVDLTAPVTTLVPTGTRTTLAGEEWYVSAVNLKFDVLDLASGRDACYASVDGSAFRVIPEGLDLATDGVHVVRYYCVDLAGNVEGEQSATFRIDTTSPLTSVTVTGTIGNNGWYRSSAVDVSLDGVDDGSGVEAVYYRVDDAAFTRYSSAIAVTGEGKHRLCYYSVDATGNAAPSECIDLNVDSVAPTTSQTFAGTLGRNDWYTSAVDVTVTPSEDTSGIGTTYYLTGSGAFSAYERPFTVSGQGLTAIQSYAVDVAGNVGGIATQNVRIDTVDPSTSADAVGTLGRNGWFTSASVSVTLARSDATSGFGETFYAIDDGAAVEYAGRFTVTGDLDHAVEYWSVDFAGNDEAHHVLRVKIDTTLPAATGIALAGTDGLAGWFTSPVTVTLTPSDATSGIDVTRFSTDAGVTFTDYSTPFTVSAQGATEVRFFARDRAGLVESPTQSRSFSIDTIAPTVARDVAGTLGDAGWFVSDVVVTLTASDATPGSGSPAIEYSLDGGITWVPYGGPITLSAPRDHSVTYRATDAAGNVGGAVEFEARVDKVAPSSSIALSATLGGAGCYVSAVVFTLSATDATSDVARKEFSLDGGATWTRYTGPVTIATQGATTVTYRAIDVAGNVESPRTETFTIDSVAPVTTRTVTGTAGENGWHVSNVTLALSATDPAPSCGAPGISVDVDGAGFGAYTGAITLSTPGDHTVRYFATDAAGNKEAVQTFTAHVDKLAPTTTHALAGTPGGGDWYTTAVRVTLSPADATSTVARTEYSLDGEVTWTRYLAPFDVATQGDTTVKYRSLDVAGNLETANAATFRIDTIKPVVSRSVAGTPGENDWHVSTLSVTLTATDSVPGSDSPTIHVIVDGAPSVIYDGPIALATEGNHSITYHAVDVAGNVGESTTANFHVDTVRPTTTRTLAGTPGLGGWWKSPVTVTLAATDATSTVALTEYTVDGGGTWTRYATPFTIADEGETSLAFRSKDVAGNLEVATVETIRIDTRAPTVTPTLTGTRGSNDWFTTNVTVTLAASDAAPGSGSPAITVRVDDGAAGPYTGAITVTTGIHTIRYFATDAAGNPGPEETLTVKVDKLAPATTHALGGTEGDAGWYVSTVTVTLTPTDATSRVADTFYSLTGGAPWTRYTGPFPVSTAGSTTVMYYSVDFAGLEETTKSVTFKIDAGTPATALSYSGTLGLEGWYVETGNATLTVSPSTSGVSYTRYGVDATASTTYTVPFPVAGDGTRVVRYYSRSTAGVDETLNTKNINIDTTDPATTATLEGTVGTGGWYVSTVTVALAATDATSLVDRTEYRILPATAWTTYTAPIVVGAQGETTIAFRSVDRASNTELEKTITFRVDTIAPSVTCTAAGTNGAADWFISDVTVTCVTSDATPGSGLPIITYTLDGGATQTYASAFVIPDDGCHDIEYLAKDAAGNALPPTTLRVCIDHLAPVTTAAPAGTLGLAGWYVSPVTVTLTATDPTSGVALTERSLDGGVTWTPYTAPFTISTQGETTVTFRSTDVAGLVETAKTITFRIDTVKPTVSPTITGTPGSADWYTSDVSVTLTPADAAPGSGSPAVSYRVGTGAFGPYSGAIHLSADGTHVVEYFATDAAGNAGDAKNVTVNIDQTDPVTTATPAGTPGLADWYVSCVTVTLSAVDPTSLVALKESSVDGGATWTARTMPFDVCTQGPTTVQYRSTDVAGNVETPKSITFRIDTIKPTVDDVLTGTRGENGWFVSSVTVALTADDASPGSGSPTIEASVDSGAFAPYATAIVLATDGKNTVDARPTDAAGNVGDTRRVTVQIDRVAPATAHALAGTTGDGGWYTSAVTVTLSPTDATSGVALTEYSLDGGSAWRRYAEPFVIAAQGTTTVQYRSKDVAGLVETARSFSVRIDTVRPATACALDGAAGDGGWFTSTVTATLKPTDATSGVRTTYYALDGGAFFTYVDAITISTDAEHTLRCYSVDEAGNAEAVQTIPVKIDSVKPQTTSAVTGTLSGTGWFTSPVTVTLSAIDGMSRVASTWWSTDGATWNRYAGEFTIDADGTRALRYYSRDVAGNQESPREQSLRIDATPPAIAAAFSGPAGANGWYTGPVRATLTAADATSGLRFAKYSIDGGRTNATYATAFDVVAEGGTNVCWHAGDQAGHVTPLECRIVKIDSRTPAITATVTGTYQNGWYRTPVGVSISATDPTPGSGLADVLASRDGGAFTAVAGPITLDRQGPNALRYFARDVAGNAANAASLSVRVDTIAPVTSLASAPAGTLGLGGWFTSAVTITLARFDAQSGVATTACRLNDAAAFPYAGPFTVTQQGVTTIRCASRDAAGNAEAESVIATVRIDSLPPAIAFASTPAPVGGFIETSIPTLTATFSGTPSGYAPASAVLELTPRGSTDAARCSIGPAAADGTRSITCSRVTWRELLPNLNYEERACLATIAGRTWCATTTIKIDADDSDFDGILNTKERGISEPYNPYSTPSDPQAWNLRVPLNDPNGTPLAADGMKAVQDRLLLTFGAYRYASDPSSSFAPARTADWTTLAHAALRTQCPAVRVQVSPPPSANLVPCEPEDIVAQHLTTEILAVTLGADSTTIHVGPQQQVIPARARVSHEPATGPLAAAGIIAIDVIAQGARVATIALRTAETTGVDVPCTPDPDPLAPPEPAPAIDPAAACAPDPVPSRVPVLVGGALTVHPIGGLPGRSIDTARLRADLESLGGELTAAIGENAARAIDEARRQLTFAMDAGGDQDGDLFLNLVEDKLGGDRRNAAARPLPRADVGDAYAVVIGIEGARSVPVPGSPVSPAIVEASPAFKYVLRLHVDDYAAGDRAVLDGKRLELAFVNVQEVPNLPAPSMPSGGLDPVYNVPAAGPAGWSPMRHAEFGFSCTIGADCPAIGADLVGDEVVVTVPSWRLSVGPFLVWAHVDLDDRAEGVDSAAGWYSAPKNAAHDVVPSVTDVVPSDTPAFAAADGLEYAITSVVLVSYLSDDPLGPNPDEDAFESFIELTEGMSDPWDRRSTPTSDDDGDGCLNQEESIPSWLVATPGGCATKN